MTKNVSVDIIADELLIANYSLANALLELHWIQNSDVDKGPIAEAVNSAVLHLEKLEAELDDIRKFSRNAKRPTLSAAFERLSKK